MARWSRAIVSEFLPVNRIVTFTWKFEIYWFCRPFYFPAEKRKHFCWVSWVQNILHIEVLILRVTVMLCGCEYCQLRVHLAPPLTRDAGQQESLTFSPALWPPNWSICSGSHAIVFFRVPLLRIIARTGSKANMPEVTAALMGMERLEEGWVGGVQVWGHYMWDEYHVSSKESIFKLRPESSNKESFVVLH